MPIYNDGGKAIKSEYLAQLSTITAGSASDNVATTTEMVDVYGYRSGKVVIAYNATIASGKALNYSLSIQDSANSTDWNTATVLATNSPILALTTGATVKDTFEVDINLAGYSRYAQFIITPDLTATATDTATLGITFIKLGADHLPAQ